MTKDRILAAARTVLEQEGVEGLTIRKVAGSAGLSPMAIYRHFADKNALLDALVSDGLARWEEIVRGIRARDPIRWLELLMEAHLAFALTEPHRYDAAFFLPAPNARRYPDDFTAGRSPVIAMVMQHVDQAKTDGRLEDRPAIEVAVAIASMGQGFISMHRAGRFASEQQFKALYRTSMRNCLEAFTPARREK